ncbi:alanine racemase [Actinospica durhamensis]|uniref:Alanine racemase n=1 Tax=Actinospica durhamensis TaxID=1508375 RepID=A0A941EWP6_9ACTN|nr:alanine racemase [Actinospica durhamensis]MBR7837727.1 alanine racemase [Actinospica durhamensis]
MSATPPEAADAAVPTSLEAVPTPALVVDLDVLDRNIGRMAAFAAQGGFALRPHAKTHRCPQIAERQLAAGAVGLTVATIGEAEVFAASGARDLFIAYPLWLDEDKRARVAALAANLPLSVGVDSAENAARLVGTGARVVIEIDSGHHRTGVAPGDAGALASAVRGLGLDVEGVFTFPGHGMARDADSGPGQVRRHAAQDQEKALAEAAESLRAKGIEPAVISGGSTPTAGLREDGVINELRPGVYVFNDAMQVALGSCTLEDVALSALATVVSVPGPDRFVLDAGSKTLGADGNAWAEGFGLVPGYPGAVIAQLSEHHAVVRLPAGARPPRHGDRVALVPNHVCNTVNLADELYVVQDGRPVHRWPVAARGANR